MTDEIKPKAKYSVGDLLCCEATDADDKPIIYKGTVTNVIQYASGKFAYDVLLQGTKHIIRHWQEDGQIVNGVMLLSPVYKENEASKKQFG